MVSRPSPGADVSEYERHSRTPSTSRPIRTYWPGWWPRQAAPGRSTTVTASAVSGRTSTTRARRSAPARKGRNMSRYSAGSSGWVAAAATRQTRSRRRLRRLAAVPLADAEVVMLSSILDARCSFMTASGESVARTCSEGTTLSDADPTRHGSRTARGAAELELGEAAIELLRSRLPDIAENTVTAIIAEVPGYTNALAGPMGVKIEGAVRLALGGFLHLAGSGDPGTPLAPALDGAYVLGRGEARSGRSMDALLAAYRVGARVAWRELSRTAVEAGLPAETLAKFAELVFAYIDELSAASVSG